MSVDSAPSMIQRFSPPDEPSIMIAFVPDLASMFAPDAWVTSETKSRPLGILSISSARIEVERALCVMAISGDSATTWTVSVSPPGLRVKGMLSCWPRRRSMFCTLAGPKPDRVAVIS